MFQRPLGIGLNDKPHLLHHIYIILPHTPCMWLLLREGFMLLVFIHPLLLSSCYLTQTLHFWWKDHFGVEPSFWLQIPRIYRRFGQFTFGPAHKLGRHRFFFCTSWLQLSTVILGITGQVLQVTSVMQRFSTWITTTQGRALPQDH